MLSLNRILRSHNLPKGRITHFVALLNASVLRRRVASCMQSQGLPGAIQVTESTYRQLVDRYRFQSRENVSVKGMGKMNTYLLLD